MKKFCGFLFALLVLTGTHLYADGVSSSTARRVVRFNGAPSNPVEGDIYENLTSHLLFYYDGTTFQPLSTRTSVTDADLALTTPFLGAPTATSLRLGTGTSRYVLDLYGALSGTQGLHMSTTDVDSGLYIFASGANNANIAVGAYFNGTNWVAKTANPGIFSLGLGSFNFLIDSGQTPGNTYTPTLAMVVAPTGLNFGSAQDLLIRRRAAASFQFGSDDAASPVAQTVTFQGSRSGTDSNVAGADAKLITSLGTGTAAGSQLLFQAGTPQASGTTQHVANTALSIKDFGLSNTQRAIISNPSGSTIIPDGNIFKVGTSDFTTSSATFVTITGLSWTMPANRATNVPFRCEILYSQATAAVANQFGIQDVSVAPTNIMAKATVWTSTSAAVNANVPTLASTTATSIVTFTPSAITTVWNAVISGFIEQPSNASESIINILVLTGNTSDAITVKRGSHCVVGL